VEIVAMVADRETSGVDHIENWRLPADPISSRDRRALQAVLSALELLSDLRDRPIPLPFVAVFLSVVLNEGRSVGWYAKELNMTRFAMSKYIRSIGPRAENNATGLKLVTVGGHRMKTAVVLTDKGRAVAAEVFRKLRGGRTHENRSAD
jgi:hypothetical protein